jgi:membrane-anchored protein YejM (alkaline phosphatase superfamily)
LFQKKNIIHSTISTSDPRDHYEVSVCASDNFKSQLYVVVIFFDVRISQKKKRKKKEGEMKAHKISTTFCRLLTLPKGKLDT